MSAQTHWVNAFFSLTVVPPGENDHPGALSLVLRVRPIYAQPAADLVSLRQVRQLGWPLLVAMEPPANAPAGGTYHDEGYTDFSWTGDDDFEQRIVGLSLPVNGVLSVCTDFAGGEATVQVRSQQLAVAGVRLEFGRARYALTCLSQANGWAHRWEPTDPALTAIELRPPANEAALKDEEFWAAIVVQYAPLELPNGLTAVGPIYAIQSDRPDCLARLDLAWHLTPAAAQRNGLCPVMGGHPAQLEPFAGQWRRDGDAIIVHGLEEATYSLAAA